MYKRQVIEISTAGFQLLVVVFLSRLPASVAIRREGQEANLVNFGAALCLWQMTTIASLRV